MILTVALFILGLFLIIKGADLLVDGAVSIASHYGVSLIVIGLTIVAFGTSAPELFVNIMASISDKGELAFGNIIGSNISNILLVMGAAALVRVVPIAKATINKDLLFNLLAFLAVLSLALLSRRDGVFSIVLPFSLVLLLFFAVYMYRTYRQAAAGRQQVKVEAGDEKTFSMGKSLLLIVIGCAALAGGGELVVQKSIEIARYFGVSEGLIGLTTVALGTSLPELATSVVAAWKGRVDLAVGNILGSNIFNIMWVLGLSSVLSRLDIPERYFTDILIMGGTVALVWLSLYIGKRYHIKRWQGGIYIASYLGYVLFLFIREAGLAN